MYMEGKILSTQVKEFDFGRGTFYLSIAVAGLCVLVCSSSQREEYQDSIC